MSGAVMFDRQILEVAFSEIDVVCRTLPEATLAALAQEVVHRVAANLSASQLPEVVPCSQEIDDLCAALLSNDPRSAANFIEDAQRKGCSYDALCLSYLAVAA